MTQSKSRYYSIVFLLAIVSVFATSCRRYQEGPLISVRTVNKRITGNYELTEFKINGVDKTNELKQAAGYCSDLFVREISEGECLIYNCDTAIVSFQPSERFYVLYSNKMEILFHKLNGFLPTGYKCFHE